MTKHCLTINLLKQILLQIPEETPNGDLNVEQFTKNIFAHCKVPTINSEVGTQP